jgi:phosphoribosylglycinamide formyltransferase-1
MKNIVLFASGNGTNVQNIAEYFAISKEICIKLIVCNKPDAYVLKRARMMQIETLVISKQMLYETEEVIRILNEVNADLIVLAGFLWLVPENLINAFPDKIINIHPSLLPKYGGKGMYGIRIHEAVVANQETFTGVTIHYVNQDYDQGKIIYQELCNITANDTPKDVAKKVHMLEYACTPKVIEKLLM